MDSTEKNTETQRLSIGEKELLDSARAMMQAYGRIITLCDSFEEIMDSEKSLKKGITKQI